MHVETTRLGRVRGFELTPTAFRRLALASAVSLYVIVLTGAVVRLTSSGLGCESWPGCKAGAFFPADSHHSMVEFGNRVVAIFPITLSLLAWVAATRTPGIPRWASRVALATLLGTVGQAPLGLATIKSDLNPVLVLSHFVLALAVLAGAVVVALEAIGNEWGRVRPLVPPIVRAAGLALVVACSALVVTGTLVTAAGPHSGGDDIRRLGNLPHALDVHVFATGVFGVSLALVVGYLVRLRREVPRVLLAAVVVLVLLGAQMAVGEIQWRTQLPWGVVLVHVALAGAVFASVVAFATVLLRPPAWFGAGRDID